MYYTKSMKTYEKLYHYLSTHPDYVSGEALAQIGDFSECHLESCENFGKKGSSD